jgi:hypothetical protein
MSQSKSAEFLRGQVSCIDELLQGDFPVRSATRVVLLSMRGKLAPELTEAEARETTHPTAADVIAEAKKALKEAEDQLVALCSRDDVPDSVTTTLAKLAAWEAAQR